MEAILLISGVAVLVIIHGIIIRTTHRVLHVAILLLVAFSGYLLFMDSGIPLLEIGALIFSIPMAVLFPRILIPDPIRVNNRLRIINCYVIIFTLIAVSNILGLPPRYNYPNFLNIPLPVHINAVVYSGVIILVTLFAALFYRLMDAYDLKKKYRMRNED